MSLLQARGLALRYAQEHPLFQAVDFEINPGDRIALVGPNGAGKSSLLRILNEEQSPDEGRIAKRRGLLLAIFLQANDGDTRQSAGQRSRAHLAHVLAAGADILLLDEPTNHLDAPGRHWLTHQLLRRDRTVLFVSHDEDFLRAVATRVFEIRRGQFHQYNGGYEFYQHQTQLANQHQWANYESEQRQIKSLHRAAERRDQLAAKVADAPPGGAISRAFYNAKSAKVARTGRLLRERLPTEMRTKKPWEEQPIPKLDFQNSVRPSDPPITLKNVTLAYAERPIVQGCQLTIRRGERWAISGPNGAGKTTLFRAIRGELQPTEGAIQFGRQVKLGYFAQEAETLASNQTPLEICLRENPDRTWVQTIFACLKLPRANVQVPIRQLSLGERAKTALAVLLVNGANVLLLDEPTNHLEIEARRALLETLQQWDGTILFVSHDAAFSEALATHTFAMEPKPR